MSTINYQFNIENILDNDKMKNCLYVIDNFNKFNKVKINIILNEDKKILEKCIIKGLLGFYKKYGLDDEISYIKNIVNNDIKFEKFYSLSLSNYKY